jgi:hypothetical protein
MPNSDRTHGERLTELETTLRMHMQSCDRKGTIAIALLMAVLAATLTGTGVLLRAALHIGGW